MCIRDRSIINFEPGYVNKNLADSPIAGLGENDILFGNRNRLIIENSITGRFIFNAIMGINLRVRHYWDKVRYQEFGRLDDEGYVTVTPYKGLNAKEMCIRDSTSCVTPYLSLTSAKVNPPKSLPFWIQPAMVTLFPISDTLSSPQL